LRYADEPVTGGRQSTKVHAPPGGQSSFNIFGGDQQPAANARKQAPAQAPVSGANAQQQQQQQGNGNKQLNDRYRSTQPW